VKRPVVITGYGVVSCQGDTERTFVGLCEQRTPVQRRSEQTHAQFPFGRVYAAEGLEEIERRLELDRTHVRAMGLSMRYANAAASIALERAGFVGPLTELGERAGLFVAARFGERDRDVDFQLASQIAALDEYEPTLNALLARQLRPGLFLAQLPNLFAGNISLIHQLRGVSMTFLGAHGAGACALVEAAELIEDGELELAVVGGCFNGNEYQAHFAMAGDGMLAPDRDAEDLRPVEAWVEGSDGTLPGAAAAFVTLEPAERAMLRGAPIRAELAHVSTQTCPRRLQPIATSLQRQYQAWLQRGEPVDAFIGNGCGAPSLDVAELEFLHAATSSAQRTAFLTSPAPGTGDVCHAALPLRVALAAAALERRELFAVPPHARRRAMPERISLALPPPSQRLDSICAIALGAHDSESLAVVRRPEIGARGM
jgi:3-oxoacyl-[acyl-carrier-protein] synthase II